MTTKPKLLLVEPRRLGDVILSIPFLRGALPSYDLHVLCSQRTAEVYRLVLPADRVIEHSFSWDQVPLLQQLTRWFVPSEKSIRSKLWTMRFDVGATVWPDPRLHYFLQSIGCTQRVSFTLNENNYYGAQRPWRRKQLYLGRILKVGLEKRTHTPLLTHALEKKSRLQSHLNSWQQLAEALGFNADTSLPWLTPSPINEDHPSNGFIKAARARNQGLWLVHPGAYAEARRWPKERWQQLLSKFLELDDHSVILIEPIEGPRLDIRHPSLLTYSPPNFADFLRILAHADMVLCLDSMAAHAASALGKKVLTLFGPQEPAWFSPFANEEGVINGEPCVYRPCFDRCVFSTPRCMESITVNQVDDRMRKFFV